MADNDAIATKGDTTVLLGIAGIAWFAGMVASAVIAQLVIALAGWNARAVTGFGGPAGALAARSVGGVVEPPVPLVAQLLLNVPLWVAFFAAVAYGMSADATLTERVRSLRSVWLPRDVAVGVIAGLVSQFGILVFIYQVLLRWLFDPRTVDDAARALTDQIRGPVDFLVMLILVGLVAPIAEELFFRGLVYRGFEGLGPRWVAIVGSGFVFGAVHFQVVQFVGLFAFGLVLGALVASTGRLAASIWAHIAFNVATVVSLGLAAL